jgi:penicillin-binding protein 1A
MMQDVVRYGTAARASQLGRSDLAGKTGTTNDARDTWFAGFNPDLVAISWMGYDQPRSLGHGETGAQSALPIWIDFMGTALKGVSQKTWATPDGIVTARINPDTGARLSTGILNELTGLISGDQPSIEEHFYQEFLPPEASAFGQNANPGTPTNPETDGPGILP